MRTQPRSASHSSLTAVRRNPRSNLGFTDRILEPQVTSMKRIATRLTFSLFALAALVAPSFGQTGVAVVNAAGFQANFPVSPGSLASAFPTGGTFTGATTAGAVETPLPTTLGGAQLLVDGTAAPLIFVFEGQINFQVSSTLAAGRHTVSVTVGGSEVASGSLDVIEAAPGVFSLDPADVQMPGAVLNQDNSVNGPDNPAARGSVVIVFGTGQGPLDGAVADGAPAPADTLISATTLTKAFVAAQEQTVIFSGLAPGFIGLWQTNVDLDDSVTGAVPLFLQLGDRGLTSNGVTIWVAQ